MWEALRGNREEDGERNRRKERERVRRRGEKRK